MEDVHERSLSLRIIDRTVVGYGAASGLVEGTIKALFYRYRSVGGFDYVGDFLISPEARPTGTQHGDSGMIWNLDLADDSGASSPADDDTPRFRPLAMQWGGQALGTDDDADVSFRRGDQPEHRVPAARRRAGDRPGARGTGLLGRVGHYSVGAYATALVAGSGTEGVPALRYRVNQLSFDLCPPFARVRPSKTLVLALRKSNKFVPLADVPDEIWKAQPPPRTSRIGVSAGVTLGVGTFEGQRADPNHYADIDAPFGPAGETWRQLCLADDRADLGGGLEGLLPRDGPAGRGPR